MGLNPEVADFFHDVTHILFHSIQRQPDRSHSGSGITLARLLASFFQEATAARRVRETDSTGLHIVEHHAPQGIRQVDVWLEPDRRENAIIRAVSRDGVRELFGRVRQRCWTPYRNGWEAYPTNLHTTDISFGPFILGRRGAARQKRVFSPPSLRRSSFLTLNYRGVCVPQPISVRDTSLQNQRPSYLSAGSTGTELTIQWMASEPGLNLDFYIRHISGSTRQRQSIHHAASRLSETLPFIASRKKASASQKVALSPTHLRPTNTVNGSSVTSQKRDALVAANPHPTQERRLGVVGELVVSFFDVGRLPWRSSHSGRAGSVVNFITFAGGEKTPFTPDSGGACRRPFLDAVALRVLAQIRRDQLGQKADRHHLGAEQHRGNGVDQTMAVSCSGRNQVSS